SEHSRGFAIRPLLVCVQEHVQHLAGFSHKPALDFLDIMSELQTRPYGVVVTSLGVFRHEIGQISSRCVLARVTEQLEPSIADLFDASVHPDRVERKRRLAIELAKLFFALTQESSFTFSKPCELPVERRCHQRQQENHERDCGY